MKIKLISVFIIFCCSLISFGKSVNIGVIVDGKTAFLDSLVQEIQIQANFLKNKDTVLEFSDLNIVYCDFNVEKISKAIVEMNKNTKIDSCIVCGMMSAEIVTKNRSLVKPFVVGPYVVFSEKINSETVDKLISSNIYPSIMENNMLEGFDNLLKHIFIKKLIIVYPKLFSEVYQYFETNVKEVLKGDVEVNFISSSLDLSSVADYKFSKNSAVLIVDKGYFNKSIIEKTIDVLLTKNIPVFTTFGKSNVNFNAVVGFSIDDEVLKTAKHMAILLENIVDGENNKTIVLKLEEKKSLIVNTNSMEKAKCYLPFDVLLNAEKVVVDENKCNKILDLKSAINLSVENNLEIEIQKREKNIGFADVKKAKSNLMPKIEISLTEAKLEKKAATSLLNIPENSLSGEVAVTQVLYSEDAKSYLSIEKNILKAKEFQLDSKILDIMLKTSNAYINVLRAKSYLKIQEDVFQLNKKNYKLAELRNEKGVTAPTDVYRWLSILAESQKTLLMAELNLQKAKLQLKRVLNKEDDYDFKVKDLDENESLLFVNNDEIMKMIDNPHNLKLFTDFLLTQINLDSPELKAYDSLINANLREVKASKRNYWLPTVAVQGKYTNMFSKWGVGSSALMLPPEFGSLIPDIPDSYWSLGLSIKFSPFSGGAKSARKIKAFENYQKTKTIRENLKNKIDTGLKILVLKMRASHDSIKLTRQSLNAATKNLKLVQEAYSNGLVDITSLLDAQYAMTGATELLKNSIYSFITDCLAIDRIATGFVSFMGEEERNKFLGKLLTFEKKYNEKEGR